MTDKAIEAVVRAIIKTRIEHGNVNEQAKAAIAAHLKTLEEEGKRVISEHDLQELVTNRKVYEG